jgi:hypothetical protein
MLDESTDALEHLNVGESGLSDDQRDQILAARGMLCKSLLIHGLLKRHGVDYGVNRQDEAMISHDFQDRRCIGPWSQIVLGLLRTQRGKMNNAVSTMIITVAITITRSPHALKKLAVPFRAADTPSERSEFAQPDIALLLTTLSYYHTGLTQDEMTEAVNFLLYRLGPSAQESHYQEWYQLAEAGMDAGELHQSNRFCYQQRNLILFKYCRF